MGSFCTECGKLHRAKNRSQYKECFDRTNAEVVNDTLDGDTESEPPLSDEMLNKPLSQMNVSDLLHIVNTANAPIRKKIDILYDEVIQKVTVLDKRVEYLESENDRKDDQINTMKSTIVNMQKCLNKIDDGDRKFNVMISGLPEADIIIDDDEEGAPLTSDVGKIKWLFRLLADDGNTVTDEVINNLDIRRLGIVRKGFSRMLKIKMPSVNDRDNLLNHAKKLKAATGAWGKVYINKDQHPVYVAENKRLRSKMFKLRREDKDAEVKITKGILYVNGIEMDKNTFFA